MRLKIMTFNLRYDKPDAEDNAWTARRGAIASLVNHYQPDIIGTQEGKAHQLLDLHRLLPAYQSIGRDRTGIAAGEYCAIFYRTQQLKCLTTGDFWLSETPEIPGSISSHWGNPLPRIATWAVFARVGEPCKITVFNTHLDYQSTPAREYGARAIVDRMSLLDASDSLLFLTGDFNAEPGTAPRETFRRVLPNGMQLRDAFASVELNSQMSFHNFTGKGFAGIDTIYYDSRSSLHEVKIDSHQWEGVWPSDHFPVLAEVVVNSHL